MLENTWLSSIIRNSEKNLALNRVNESSACCNSVIMMKFQKHVHVNHLKKLSRITDRKAKKKHNGIESEFLLGLHLIMQSGHFLAVILSHRVGVLTASNAR